MLAFGMFVAVVGVNMATHSNDVAFAGEQDPCATPDPTPDPTVDPTQIVSSFGEVVDCDPPGGAPDLTPSPAPTNTPAPDPTSPPPPPPATATPSGGAGAGGVEPPNTGDGSSTSSASTAAFLLAGLALTLGGGLVAVGARRRS